MIASPPEFAASVWLLVALCVFIHASLQLGISVLTLLSGHSLGRGTAQRRLAQTTSAYVIGSFITTLLLFCLVLWLRYANLITGTQTAWLWLVILSVTVGVIVVTAYYRSPNGTSLWIPRSFADYLARQAKRSKTIGHALWLGSLTVLTELPFSIVPLAIIGLLVAPLSPQQLRDFVFVYSLLVTLPLMVVGAMVSGGHSLGTIQRWRDRNKSFLQWSTGLCLIAMGFLITSFYLLGAAS